MKTASGSSLRRLGLKVAVGSSFVFALALAFAYKTLFALPGEAALRFVPATSLLAGTIDLNPSPAQTLAFKHIDDALDRNGMTRMMEGSILGLFGKSPVLDAMSPYVLRNGAFALVPWDDKGDTAPVAMISLSDPGQTQAILAKRGKPTYWRGTKCYTLEGVHGSYFMVVDDVLMVGAQAPVLHEIQLTAEGQKPSITNDAAFLNARSHLAADANLMIFLNPKAISTIGVKNVDQMKMDWGAAGIAVRDGGLGLSTWNRFDPSSLKGLSALSQTQGLRNDLLQLLPQGAYGMVALSQPAKYFDQFETTARDQSDDPHFLDGVEKTTRENLGLDLHQDLLAGLTGDAVVAAYPSKSGEPGGVDFLMVVDNQNGAKPAEALDRFQKFVREQSDKEGSEGPLFPSSNVDGNTIFRISDKMESDMRKDIGDGMDPGVVNKSLLLDNKTIAWSTVNGTVVAASSQELLTKAISSVSSHGNSLASDTGFIKSDSDVMDGSQILAVFNLGRIAAGIGNTVGTEKMDADGRKAFTSITEAFEKLVDPFYLKAKLSPDGQLSVGAFIPIDYDKVIDFAGENIKKK